MRLERRLKPNVLLNMTPLVDVVLMLVIFFMITSVFKTAPGIDIDLPKSATATNVALSELHVIAVSEDEIYLGKVRTNLVGLDTLIQAEIADKDLSALKTLVEGDKGASYQLMVSILDVMRKNKIQGVSLLTRGEVK